MQRGALSIVVVAAAWTLAACSAGAPAWAELPEHHVLGDATIAGAPAPIARFAHAPTIDGALDDDAWKHATTLGPFVDPGDGTADRSVLAPSFARAGWDDHALYLAFVVRDRSPAAPFARTDVDPHVWERSSAVEAMIQPGDRRDNRGYFEFQVDTAGAVFDSAWDDYNVPIASLPAGRVFGHQDWSAHATRASRIASGAYAIEVAIPFASLSRDRGTPLPIAGAVWRLNLYAFRDGQSIANAWSPLHGEGNFHHSARWGRIRFSR